MILGGGPVIRQRKVQSQRRRDGLIRFAFDNTSQNGEDGIIAKLFEVLPPSCHDHDDGDGMKLASRWCVDVGAWDGKHLSNTYSLLIPSIEIKERKNIINGEWRGVLIEAEKEKFLQLQNLHGDRNVCLHRTVSCLPNSASSLSTILSSPPCDKIALPYDFDFLCIDVDGPDYWILHDLLHTKRQSSSSATITTTAGSDAHNNDSNSCYYRPKVICIEFNPTMPHSLVYIQACNDSTRQGSSLAALVQLAENANYVLVETTLYNAFFVSRHLFDTYLSCTDLIPFGLEECTIEKLHTVSMGTTMYQLYDGTLKIHGCKKLLWHRLPIDEDKIQILNRNEQSFPFAPSYNDGSDLSSNGGTNIGNDRNRLSDQDVIDNKAQVQQKQQEENDECIRKLAVDMSPYCFINQETNDYHNNTQERAECAKKLLLQLQNDGFALVTKTNLCPNLCHSALQATRSFLHQAPEAARRYCLSKTDRARRGYSPQNSENFASLVGEKGANDLVRKFRVGPPPLPDGVSDSGKNVDSEDENLNTLQRQHRKSCLFQPNIFPTEEVWSGDDGNGNTNIAAHFQTTIEEYYKESCRVANDIVCAIVDGLIATMPHLKPHLQPLTNAISNLNANVDANENEMSSLRDTSILTLLGYRKGARHQGKNKRPLIAAHTDVGVVTFLLFDSGNCAVLQRASETHCDVGTSNITTGEQVKEWVDVKLPRFNTRHNTQEDPVFVVNIGDCLSELTDGLLPSTLHRVMPRHGNDPRSCLAMFVGLRPEEMLTFPSSAGSSSYCDDGNDCARISYEEWRKRRIARAAQVIRSSSKRSNI